LSIELIATGVRFHDFKFLLSYQRLPLIEITAGQSANAYVTQFNNPK
jgi:hypothetical protein